MLLCAARGGEVSLERGTRIVLGVDFGLGTGPGLDTGFMLDIGLLSELESFEIALKTL